jgi:predicted branched-subunit amino acid permease
MRVPNPSTLGRSEFVSGIKTMMPLLVGAAPFAAISGIVAINVGMSPILVVAMSVLVFAGSSQLVAVQLLGQHSPIVVIVFATFVVNLRFLMYSASLAPFMKRLSRLWKLGLAYLITDQAFAVSIVHYHGLAIHDADNEPREHYGEWFFLGGGAVMWLAWQLFTVAGVVIGSRLPLNWPLDFAVPLTFLALAVPTIKDRPAAVSAAVAGAVAVVAYPLPYKLGLVLATLIGICAGVWAEASKA